MRRAGILIPHKKGCSMRRSIVAGVLALLVLPAAADAMTVAQFLAKAKALEAKGAAGATSSDRIALRDEIQTVATAYRADLDAASVAGEMPRACPPPKGKAKIDPGTLIAAFQEIPRAKRKMSVQSAFNSFMDKRYPCPADDVRPSKHRALFHQPEHQQQGRKGHQRHKREDHQRHRTPKRG
jgi:hypothetical protein